MGAQMVYLREPVTGKEVEEGGDFNSTGVHYGLAAMQGWRRNMEDAHLAVPSLDDKVSLFGVFDGHGGRGVSRFAAGKLPDLLRQTEAYKAGNYVKALEMAFLAVDEKLREAEGRKEIEALDLPDAGAAIHPLVVPKKVLEKFLGSGAQENGEEQEGERGEGEAATEGEAAADGKAAVDGEAVADGETAQAQEGEAAGCAPSPPEVDDADKENRPQPESINPDEAETEEEPAAEDSAEALGLGDPDLEDEDNEDYVDDDMALVDPARLTRDPTPEAQGCTAVVVLVVRREDGGGPRIFCANAGDSRAILSRAGNVVALSEDHKPENPGETARIRKAGGFVQQMPGGARVQGDLNLSRAMGDLRYKKPENLPPEEQIVTVFPEVRTFELTSEDEFMVLGCDGIWERTENQEMVDFVRPRMSSMLEHDNPQHLHLICGDICDKGLCPSMDANEYSAFDGTGCDNMTVMIVRLQSQLSSEGRKRSADKQEPEVESKRQKQEEPEKQEEESGKEEQT